MPNESAHHNSPSKGDRPLSLRRLKAAGLPNMSRDEKYWLGVVLMFLAALLGMITDLQLPATLSQILSLASAILGLGGFAFWYGGS